jgi:hypothetical protein
MESLVGVFRAIVARVAPEKLRPDYRAVCAKGKAKTLQRMCLNFMIVLGKKWGAIPPIGSLLEGCLDG